MHTIENILKKSMEENNYPIIDSIIFICKVESLRCPDNILSYKKIILKIKEYYSEKFSESVSKEMATICNYSKTSVEKLYNITYIDIINNNITSIILGQCKMIEIIKIPTIYKIEYIENILSYFISIDVNIVSEKISNILTNLKKIIKKEKRIYNIQKIFFLLSIDISIFFIFSDITIDTFIILFFASHAIIFILQLCFNQNKEKNSLIESLIFTLIVFSICLSGSTFLDKITDNKIEHTAKVETIIKYNDNLNEITLKGTKYLTSKDYLQDETITYKTGLNPFIIY